MLELLDCSSNNPNSWKDFDITLAEMDCFSNRLPNCKLIRPTIFKQRLPFRDYSKLPASFLAAIYNYLIPYPKTVLSSGSLGRGSLSSEDLPSSTPSDWKESCNFRLVCKEFHRSSLLPSQMKLVYPVNFSAATRLGLTNTFRLQQNQSTKLDLSVHEFDTVSATFLLQIGKNLTKLCFPATSNGIRFDISFILSYCPLQEIKLMIKESTFSGGVLFSPPLTSSFYSLSTLELFRVSSASPACLESALDLRFLYGLESVKLTGPIVYSSDPGVLPQLVFREDCEAIVTVDPGLNGRTPTRWARAIRSGGPTLMSSPLPRDADYEEEDEKARQDRIDDFVSESAEDASQRVDF